MCSTIQAFNNRLGNIHKDKAFRVNNVDLTMINNGNHAGR